MACLIDAWRHIHLPSLHCIREIKKFARPLIRTVCCRGWTTSTFSSGGTPTFATTPSFFALLAAAGFARVTPLPPDGFVLVRWERGLCGDFCTSSAPSVLCPAAGRFGRATRSFSLLIGNFHRPVSLEDVNPLSLSLYIFIISRSVHFMNWSCQVWIWNAQSWSCTPLLIIKYNGLKCR